MIARLLVFLMALNVPAAFAAAYKCVSLDGAVSFASVPCAPGSGESSVVPQASGNQPVQAKVVAQQAPQTVRLIQVRTTFTHTEHVTLHLHRGNDRRPTPQDPPNP